MKFKQFMRYRGFGASVFMGIFYAVAMLLIFLLGYTALPGNMDELKIALVNEDKGEALPHVRVKGPLLVLNLTAIPVLELVAGFAAFAP